MADGRSSFEAVRGYPDGSSTASRFASKAATLGFDGLILRNGRQAFAPESMDAIGDRFDLTLIAGMELTPAVPDDASGRLPQLREEVPVVIVAGGTVALNRFVAEQRHVDVLARPITADGPSIEVGTAKTAKEHDVAIELDFAPVRATGGRRVRYLKRLGHLWRVIDAYDVPFVVSGRPESHLELRAPRELAAMGHVIGIGEDDIHRGLARWRKIVARNRSRRDERFIEPGVQRVTDEAEDR